MNLRRHGRYQKKRKMGVTSDSQTRWSDLFPTRWSPVIFVLYMALFINQGILVTASQSNKGYTYNTVMAVLLTEFIKLIVSSGLFIQRNSFSIFTQEVSQNKRVFFLYFIPAGLYCLYNNLAYVNLVTFDPTTYFLLLQFRVVVTGIVFQVLFQKKLSRHQWISLIFLTVGCMVKEINFSGLFGVEDADEPLAKGAASNDKSQQVTPSSGGATKSADTWVLFENPFGVVLILLQVLCSSGAGVYNEFLLKRPVANQQKQTPILIQNVCLYIDSIICNITLLAWQGNLSSVLKYETLGIILYTPIILAVVINNAAIGIVTSFFLAQLNSILKTFASALELMFTAVLCWMIFGIPIHLNTIVAILIVTWAIFLYSKEPVVNPANTNVTTSSVNNNNRRRGVKDVEDMQKILDEEIDV